MTSTNTDSDAAETESNVEGTNISSNDESEPIVSEDEFESGDEIVAEAASVSDDTDESGSVVESTVDVEFTDTDSKEENEDVDEDVGVVDGSDDEPLVTADEFGVPEETTSTADTSIGKTVVDSESTTVEENEDSFESRVGVDEQQEVGDSVSGDVELDSGEDELESPISEPIEVTGDERDSDVSESDTTGVVDAWDGGSDTIDSGFDAETQSEADSNSREETRNESPIETPDETGSVNAETQPRGEENEPSAVQSSNDLKSSSDSNTSSTWGSNENTDSSGDSNAAVEAQGEQSTFDSGVETAPVSDEETQGETEIISEEEIIPPVETKGRVRSPKELLVAPKNIFVAGIVTVLTGVIGVCIGIGHVVKVMLDYLVGFTVLIYLALTGIGLLAPSVVTGLTNGFTAVEATTRLGVTAELMMVYVPPIAIGVAISKGLEYALGDDVETETTTEPAL